MENNALATSIFQSELCPDCKFPSSNMLGIPDLRLDMQAEFADIPFVCFGEQKPKDEYSSQEKVDFILSVNNSLKSTGVEGLKVRSLSLNESGTLEVGSIGIKIDEGSSIGGSHYATVRSHIEPGRTYYTVDYTNGGVKFDTQTLADVKKQINAQMSRKYRGVKNPYDDIHGINAHVMNTKEERNRADIISFNELRIYSKKK